MSCEHEWAPRQPSERLEKDRRVTEGYQGVQCVLCGHLRGGNRGLVLRRIETPDGPKGAIPDWLRLRVVDGEAEFRLPDSFTLCGEAEALAWKGIVDAEFRYNSTKRDWVVAWIRAPQATTLTPRLVQARQDLLQRIPGSEWVGRASLRDVETALAITAIPNWKTLEWPEKVWNGRLREHTKQGNASRIARRLGLSVPERGVAVWLYGTGSLRLDDGSHIIIQGETCISTPQAQRISEIEVARVGFVENPDAALMHGTRRPGLVVATWGALKPTHLHLLQAARRLHLPTWCSFDMDPEGVRFARLALDAGIGTVEGFRAWPKTLGQALDDEKLLILNQEAAIPNHPFKEVLEYIRSKGAWWEQETTMNSDGPPLK